MRLAPPLLCSTWPDSDLNLSGMQLETLERRAGLVTEYELERRKLEILGRLSDQYAALGPQLKDMGLYIAELKQYLQVGALGSWAGRRGRQVGTAEKGGHAARQTDLGGEAKWHWCVMHCIGARGV